MSLNLEVGGCLWLHRFTVQCNSVMINSISEFSRTPTVGLLLLIRLLLITIELRNVHFSLAYIYKKCTLRFYVCKQRSGSVLRCRSILLHCLSQDYSSNFACRIWNEVDVLIDKSSSSTASTPESCTTTTS